MASRPNYKNRREHLKNLRKIRKGKQTSYRTVAAHKSSKGLFMTLGILFSVAVLALLVGSALMQYKDSRSTPPVAQTQAVLPAVDPSTIEVRVLNGCGDPGAGRGMTSHLRDLRFDVVAAGNADNFEYQQTVVVNHSERPELGQAVAAALGCQSLTSQPDEMAMVDVTVILGKDWQKYVVAPQPPEKRSMVKRLLSKARSLLR
jgi:hypothetical protein